MSVGLKCHFLNARSLKRVTGRSNDLLCMKTFLETTKPDVVIINETWLDTNVLDKEL